MSVIIPPVEVSIYGLFFTIDQQQNGVESQNRAIMEKFYELLLKTSKEFELGFFLDSMGPRFFLETLELRLWFRNGLDKACSSDAPCLQILALRAALSRD